MAARNAFFIIFGVIVELFITLAEGHGHDGDVKFSYSGGEGPEHWGKLSPQFSACSNGKAQSPINIVTKNCIFNDKLKPLCRDYHEQANATLINQGFNVGVSYGNGIGSAFIDNQNYTLKQMHWHSPSEHTLDGVRYPLELHLVHEASDGSVAVIGVLYQYGDADPLLVEMEESLAELSKEACGSDEESHIEIPFLKTSSLDRKSRKYYRYVGSFTTPPCTENVIWTILGKVRDVSKEQVEALKAPLDIDCKNNSRPLQPLNDRHVETFHDLL